MSLYPVKRRSTPEGNIVHNTFAGEVQRSFENVSKILSSAGVTLQRVVTVAFYVGRQEDLAEYNRLYHELFTDPYPARTTLIGCLGDVVKFEVDVAIAEQLSSGS